MRLAVKGIGVTGGFGCGVAELAAAMKSGASKMNGLSIPSAQGALQLPAFRAETERLEEFVAKRTLRRIDRYSKMGLLGSYLALQDAGMLGSDLSRVGVVIASGYGATDTTFAFLDSIIADGDICASPTHFANSVHNSAAANISIMLGAKGPSLTVSQFDMSVPSALITARQWLAERRVDAVLFGAIDEVSDLIGYVWHRQRAHAKDAIAPLNFDEESSIIGEGAAFLVLTRDEDGEGYCAIDDVVMGNIYGGTLPLPGNDSLLVLGADGRKELGLRYRDLVPSEFRVASYAPLYGSMPAAPGFDLACAALLLKDGEEAGPVCALKLAEANAYSLVSVSRL
jgi:3-oxoacyl-[acyl-carrier-protein] synthase II